MYLPGIPKDLVEQTREALRLPEGALEFRYRSDGLFDSSLARAVLMQVVSGKILLRLERNSNLDLRFFHSSPGTGTRVATVNLDALKGSSAVRIALAWSPVETRLHVADASNPLRSVMGTGRPSKRKFRIGDDGAVYQVGNEDAEVRQFTVFGKGRPVLQPTAFESWKDTVEATKILLKGTSPDGYIFENIITNMAIVMLVTGFETYCKRRFLELEDEGIKANFNSLINEFLSRRERESGESQVIAQEAADEDVSPLRKLVGKKIDFGNYDRCKMAYNKGYGIKFGEDLGISNKVLEELQRLIGYRGRLVHVSPLIGMLNQEKVPPEKPVFANRQYAEVALKTVCDFIQGLHDATLRLRPRE